MYCEEIWRDGWLWTRSNPRDPLVRASTETTIRYLAERVAFLEELIAERGLCAEPA